MKKKKLSPRQAAIYAREKWYMPHPPKRCPNGHLAMRRVSDGFCRDCHEAFKQKPPRLDELCPDMVISREDARTLGFTVYRHLWADSCRSGRHFHAWHYVSTNRCVDCDNNMPLKIATADGLVYLED